MAAYVDDDLNLQRAVSGGGKMHAKVVYINTPKVQIRNGRNFNCSMQVNLPHIVFQIFDVAEIQD